MSSLGQKGEMGNGGVNLRSHDGDFEVNILTRRINEETQLIKQQWLKVSSQVFVYGNRHENLSQDKKTAKCVQFSVNNYLKI